MATEPISLSLILSWIAQFILLLVIPIWMVVVAIRDWRARKVSVRCGLGFRFDRWMPVHLAAGAVVAILMLAFISGLGLAADRLSFGSLVPNEQFAEFSIMFFVMAVIEEVLFRSMMLNGLLVKTGNRIGLTVIIAAALFGVIHLTNPNVSALSLIGNTIGGAIYSLAFLRTRTIWFALSLHYFWNFLMGPVLGFPVSGESFGGWYAPMTDTLIMGGEFGPEAGVFGIVARGVVVTILAVSILRRKNAPTAGNIDSS